jgi:hypothetical protein
MASNAPLPGREACTEKEQLLDAYDIAALDYSQAVQLLSERTGVMSRAKYVRVRDYSEKARLAAEVARDALDRHITAHGC